METFAQPVIVLDTPSAALIASPATIASFSGQDTSLTAQGDVHAAAAHTASLISGQTTSLYTHQGELQAIAANGDLSLRAHTDQLEILADQDITVISVNGEITITASKRIEIVGGDSKVVLDGPNIDFITPGTFISKAATNEWAGGGSGSAVLPHLPSGLTKIPLDKAQFRWAYHDGEPAAGAPYTATLADGSVRTGRLDSAGFVQFDDVPAGGVDIVVGLDPRPFEKFKLPAKPDDDATFWYGGGA